MRLSEMNSTEEAANEAASRPLREAGVQTPAESFSTELLVFTDAPSVKESPPETLTPSRFLSSLVLTVNDPRDTPSFECHLHHQPQTLGVFFTRSIMASERGNGSLDGTSSTPLGKTAYRAIEGLALRIP